MIIQCMVPHFLIFSVFCDLRGFYMSIAVSNADNVARLSSLDQQFHESRVLISQLGNASSSLPQPHLAKASRVTSFWRSAVSDSPESTSAPQASAFDAAYDPTVGHVALRFVSSRIDTLRAQDSLGLAADEAKTLLQRDGQRNF